MIKIQLGMFTINALMNLSYPIYRDDAKIWFHIS